MAKHHRPTQSKNKFEEADRKDSKKFMTILAISVVAFMLLMYLLFH